LAQFSVVLYVRRWYCNDCLDAWSYA